MFDDSQDSINNPPTSHSDTPPLEDLAGCFRLLSESVARTDLAETHMIKERETSRWEAEKRRMELDAQLTRLMLDTQLQIASIVAANANANANGKRVAKKRKRIQEEDQHESSISRQRKGALLLCLLQCNFSF